VKTLFGGARIELYETLDSTSSEAKRRAADGECGPLWIVALEQTAGYGRRGRAWESGAGDFAGTFLFAPDGDPASFGQLSFVVALAAYDALETYAPAGALSLKWPNDVLADGAKLAGLLLERIDHEGRACVAFGIGVNIASAPKGLPYATAKLAALTKTPPSPEDLAAAIDLAFQRRYRTWLNDGFSPVRDAWLRRAKGIGESVRVRLPDEEVFGLFEGLDETGALILKQGDARRLINAGEIMFGE
jgi:BirA family biotin operon repressor/biotin-[acetyl-CoA-carboxylase] ligase